VRGSTFRLLIFVHQPRFPTGQTRSIASEQRFFDCCIESCEGIVEVPDGEVVLFQTSFSPAAHVLFPTLLILHLLNFQDGSSEAFRVECSLWTDPAHALVTFAPNIDVKTSYSPVFLLRLDQLGEYTQHSIPSYVIVHQWLSFAIG
jgi:hypothetical protein